MLRKTVIPILALCLLPSAAMAQKVAVLPASYQRVDTGEQVPDAAAKVTAKVAEGAKEAGFAVSDEAEVKAALEELGDPEGCTSVECLKELRDKLEVDDAVHVTVSDDEQMSFAVSVALAGREGLVEERTDGFFVVLEWIRGSVALALQKPPLEEPVVEGPAEPGTDEEAGGEDEGEGDGDETSNQDEKSGLSPVPFYISAGITGALVLSWGITDIVVHKKYKDLEDSDKDRAAWEDDRDSAQKLQTVDRVLLGVAAAGLVTTGILFFLTDFDKESNGEAELQAGVKSAGPMLLNNGGGLSINGSF